MDPSRSRSARRACPHGGGARGDGDAILSPADAFYQQAFGSSQRLDMNRPSMRSSPMFKEKRPTSSERARPSFDTDSPLLFGASAAMPAPLEHRSGNEGPPRAVDTLAHLRDYDRRHRRPDQQGREDQTPLSIRRRLLSMRYKGRFGGYHVARHRLRLCAHPRDCNRRGALAGQ